MMKVFWYIFVVAMTLVVLFLIWQFSFAILLFLLSLAIAAALRPLINNIAGNHNISRRFALAIVYFSVISLILIFILLIAPPLGQDLQEATDDLVTGYDRIKLEWPSGPSMFQKALGQQLPPSGDLYQALTSPEAEPARQDFFGAALNFFSMLGSIVVVIILSLYWSADQLRFERLGLSLLPKEQHPKALHIWRSVEMTVGSFIRSEIIQGVLALVLLAVGYWLVGIRYPTLFALWAAFVRVIPWFGVLLAIMPPLFVAAGGSAMTGLLAILYTIGVLIVLKVTVEPRFFVGKRNNSLFMLVFVISAAQIFGLLGAILAPILAVAIQVLSHEFYPSAPYRFSPPIIAKTEELRKRLTDFRSRLPQPFHPEIELLLNRLGDLLDRTKHYVQE